MSEYNLQSSIYTYVEQNAVGLEQSIRVREHTIAKASVFLDSDRERLATLNQWLEDHKADKPDEED